MSENETPSGPLSPLDPVTPPQPPPVQPPGGPPAQSQPPPAGAVGPSVPVGRPARRSSALKVIVLVVLGLLFFGSLMVNMVLLSDLGAGVQLGTMETQVVRKGSRKQVVAMYHVTGILDSRAVKRFEQFHKSVAKDPDVKAVVLRVNSPGGGVTASDQICRMVRELRDKGKTVVVSMGSLAASGGYYVSAPADEIYAEATSVTGSIGVVAMWIVLKGTLEKVGAEAMVLKSTNAEGWKDEMSTFRKPHDYQLAHIREVLDKMQTRFERVVKDGRGPRLKPKEATYTVPGGKDGKDRTLTETEPFNGKIYLADEALKLGLIDAIGYEAEAIDRAAALAKLGDPRVVRYARRASLMERLMRGKVEPAIKLGPELLDEIQTPRFMMIWKAD